MSRAAQILGEERADRVMARFDELARLATLEQVLAGVCTLIPVALIVFDDFNVRGSISAYYKMVENQWFYVPLAAAALLFIVNGVVKKARFYNWMLGVALLVVLMFDHEGDSAVAHFAAATIFFVGNAAVMLFYAETDIERRLRWPLVATVAVAMLAWWLVDWFTLFWAEWLSLLVIATHFLLTSRR